MRWTHRLALLCVLSPACRPHPNSRADSGADPATRRRPPESVQIIPSGEDNRWTLAGTLYRAPFADESNRGVLLVHQLGSSKEEWAPLIERLRARRGITTLAIDLRGHGQSARGPNGQPVTWESFGNSTELWAGLVRDVSASVRFLRGTVNATSIVIVGSSIGASAAMISATSDQSISENIAGLVMFSPGLAYHGLDIREASTRYAATNRPLLMLAGELDEQSAQTLHTLAETLRAHAQQQLFPTAREHGVSLANSAPARWNHIDAWIRDLLKTPLLPPHRPAPPRPPPR